MLRTWTIAAAALAVILPAKSAAQADAALSAFSKGHFKGARTSISGPAQYNRPLIVRSLIVPAGTEWELCSGLTYTGCRQVKGTVPSMIMTVRSARPVAAVLPAIAPIVAVGTHVAVGPHSGPSLRGMASEYFVAPDERGNRVEVTPGTAEAMSRRASEFCRARGWRSSQHGRLQTAAGKVYLADVLCVDR